MIFALVFSLFMVIIYLYIGRSLSLPFELSRQKKRLIAYIMMIGPLLMLLSFLFRFRMNSEWLSNFFGWTGYILFGFFSIVFAFLVVKDIGRLGLKIFDKFSKKEPPVLKPERRQFIARSVNMGILGASAIMTGYGLYEAKRRPILEQVEVPVRGLPPQLEGFKIAQFTDLHIGPTIKRAFVESVVRQVSDLQADAIVFTGDLVDGTVDGLSYDVEPLKELQAPYGKYFITGNHEYYSFAIPWITKVVKLGFFVLLNDHRVINVRGKNLVMAGVTDFSAGRFIPKHESDPGLAIVDAPVADAKILLAHQPRSIFAAAQYGYDLQISGHTHGGQYIPWNTLVTLNQPFIKGLNKFRDTWVYVSRGTGYWGPPLRFGVPSEVTLLTLKRAPDLI